MNPTNTAISEAQWIALWTHSHCEQRVYDQLIARQFDAFLPMIGVWSRRGNSRRVIPRPLFPGYLFLRHAIDKSSYIEILKTRGLARILGDRWDRVSVVGDAEIDAIQRVLGAGLPAISYLYLHVGQRVRIIDGPLKDVEGILVHNNPKKGLLVLSIDLLRRSVAVEVDCTLVTPVDGLHAATVPARPTRAASVYQ